MLTCAADNDDVVRLTFNEPPENNQTAAPCGHLVQPAASVYDRPFNQAIDLIAREIRFTMM